MLLQKYPRPGNKPLFAMYCFFLHQGYMIDPFGNDVNDLPMEKLAENISGNVEEILGMHQKNTI